MAQIVYVGHISLVVFGKVIFHLLVLYRYGIGSVGNEAVCRSVVISTEFHRIAFAFKHEQSVFVFDLCLSVIHTVDCAADFSLLSAGIVASPLSAVLQFHTQNRGRGNFVPFEIHLPRQVFARCNFQHEVSRWRFHYIIFCSSRKRHDHKRGSNKHFDYPIKHFGLYDF